MMQTSSTCGLMKRAAAPPAMRLASPFHLASISRRTAAPAPSRCPVHARASFLDTLRAPLDNLFGGAGKGGKTADAADPRGAELAEELLELALGSDGGQTASSDTKERISEVVEALSRYSIKNPVRSPLLWGEYEMVYCSKPAAVGGPLKKGPGPLLFRGQAARQVLEPPNKATNIVEFKTLGLLPGFSRQYGELEPVDGDTFIINITRGEIQVGGGVGVKKEFDIRRRIRIPYLDATLRVAQFMPDETLVDSENLIKSQSEEILFVFRRMEASGQDDEDEEDNEEGDAEEGEAEVPAEAQSMLRRLAGAATQRITVGGEERKQQAEDKAAQRQAAEEAKAEERERVAATREQLMRLSDELKEAGADAKEAAAELRDVERASSAVLKGAAAAAAQVSRAEDEVAEAEAELQEAAGLRRAAEAALRAALAEVGEAEAAARGA